MTDSLRPSMPYEPKPDTPQGSWALWVKQEWEKLRPVIATLAILLSLCSTAGAVDDYCGLDTDHNGSITLCTNGDNDRDGFTVAQGDCDDTDPNYYPGRGRATGCSANEAKNCPLSGSGVETACSSGGWKPEGCTTAYYMDITAANNNSATPTNPSTPWKNQLCFTSYYNVGDRPACYHDPVAGDCLVARAGTYGDVYTYDTGGFGFFLRNKSGTSGSPIQVAAFPGETVNFQPSTVTYPAVSVLSSDYVRLIGFQVHDARGVGYQTGNNGAVNINGGTGDRVVGLTIYNIDGNQSGNLAGIHTNGTTNAQITNNNIWDVGDTCTDNGGNSENTCGGTCTGGGTCTNGTSENNSGIVDFDSQNLRIARNKILNSAIGKSNCIKKKHTNNSVTTRTEIDWNWCYKTKPDLETYAFGFSGSVWLHHNWVGGLPAGAAALQFRDFGGQTNFTQNSLIEYNTFATGGFDYRPSKEYVANTFANFTTQKNIIIDERSSGNIISVCPDGSNAYHTDLISGAKMTWNNNCYDLPNLGTFPVTIFGNNPGAASYCGSGATNNAGATYSTLAGWGETGAVEAAPALDSNQVPATSSCSTFGLFGDWTGGGSGGGSTSRRKGQFRKSGRKGA